VGLPVAIMLKFIQQNLIAIIIYQLVITRIFLTTFELTTEYRNKKERLFQLKQTLFSDK
jgi:hypothetical protein